MEKIWPLLSLFSFYEATVRQAPTFFTMFRHTSAGAGSSHPGSPRRRAATHPSAAFFTAPSAGGPLIIEMDSITFYPW